MTKTPAAGVNSEQKAEIKDNLQNYIIMISSREDTTTTTTRGKSNLVSETLKSLNSGKLSELDSKK